VKQLFRQFTRQRLIGAGAAFALLAAAGLFVLVSGVYSVAASRGHFAITGVILEIAMRRSVALHSYFVRTPQPSLQDENLVRLGAAHYFRGCAFCHGAPGSPGHPATHRMLPAPPNLAVQVNTWSDRELFWIVQNGLKYTGMPAWPAAGRGDEVWAVVAFLRKMPEMNPDQYKALAGISGKPPLAQSPPAAALERAIAECARCHGDGKSPPSSNVVPVIAGQNLRYLREALRTYSNGLRPSGMMQLPAAELSEELREPVLRHFAQLAWNGTGPAPARDLASGRAIALSGIPERGIPACVICHDSKAADTFPRLFGQSAPYLRDQLRLFFSGTRSLSPQAAIMATIAKRLTEAEMDAVSAYLAARKTAEAEPQAR
jgi:cytochrome c553